MQRQARSGAALALALMLAACGGDAAPPAAAPRVAARPAVTPAVTPAAAAAAEPARAARSALRVGYVEYPAAHGLHAYADIPVVLELEQAGVKHPALELQAAGRTLGRVALARPGATAAHDGGRYWSATIPAAWAIRGVSWRAVADSHDASPPRALPLAD